MYTNTLTMCQIHTVSDMSAEMIRQRHTNVTYERYFKICQQIAEYAVCFQTMPD